MHFTMFNRHFQKAVYSDTEIQSNQSHIFMLNLSFELTQKFKWIQCDRSEYNLSKMNAS